MNQPNLQAIITKVYRAGATRTTGMDEAIDAIYAGLLAEVIGRNESGLPITDIYRTSEELQQYYADIASRDELRTEQTKALKRWIR